MAKSQTPHIAIMPSPGMGHLIPLAEFVKRLVRQHDFTVTFFIPTTTTTTTTTTNSPSKAQKSILDSLPSSVEHIFLHPVDLSDLPERTKAETKISLTLARSLSFLREALISLATEKRVVALVVDLFGTDGFDVAKEFNIAPYIFFPSTAMTLSLFLNLEKLDRTVSSEFRDMPEPVRISGCIPVHGKELLDPTQDRENDAYKWLLHHTKRYRLAEGIMLNSFEDIEPGAITALLEKEPGKPPVYPVGPLVNIGPSNEVDDSGCLKWLDDQPHGSVLYVSFGSGGTLSYDQITELAHGLEMSRQRFLWVVRSPNDTVAKNPFDCLPKGFLERTNGGGLVVPSWAPQARVLSHESTAGFLTHCGWNSVLESVVNGVPMIAWPLYAEQKMNASMLNKDIKVASRPIPNTNGLVCRDEIEKTVKDLMEGQEGKRVRNRMKCLKEASDKVLGKNGSSTNAFYEVINKWSNRI